MIIHPHPSHIPEPVKQLAYQRAISTKQASFISLTDDGYFHLGTDKCPRPVCRVIGVVFPVLDETK